MIKYDSASQFCVNIWRIMKNKFFWQISSKGRVQSVWVNVEAFRCLDQHEPATSWINDAQSRLDEEAHQLQEKFANGEITLKQLENKRHSYHPSDTFSVNYPFGGILDALGPDLLHQISKCFMDYMMKQ